MSKVICYMPTYSPSTEANKVNIRPYTRATNQEIDSRLANKNGMAKPSMYMDAADSILNVRPDIKLVVADGRSTDSIREEMHRHHEQSGGYTFLEYPEKKSQWWIFNNIYQNHLDSDTEYFVYSSSDVIWKMDWVAEAIKEFERNPKLQILFPTVNNGDINLPCQLADGPRDVDPILPPYQKEAKAPVLNAYAMIFRMDFLKTYGGYPTVFRNCFTESFLHFMCEAMGGEMRLMPRGWVYHWGIGDTWGGEYGSAYYYNEEKFVFQEVMNKTQMHKAMNLMDVNFLKKYLYK